MEKVCNEIISSTCNRLIDYVVIVGLDFDHRRDSNARQFGRILQRFPAKDWPDIVFNPAIVHFCQPKGWRTFQEYENPSFFVFVLTDEYARRQYCACLSFLEPTPTNVNRRNAHVKSSDTLRSTDMNSSFESPDRSFKNNQSAWNSFVNDIYCSDACNNLNNIGNGFMVSSDTIKDENILKHYAPKCIVLVSRVDLFETFKSCLKEIYLLYADQFDNFSYEKSHIENDFCKVYNCSDDQNNEWNHLVYTDVRNSISKTDIYLHQARSKCLEMVIAKLIGHVKLPNPGESSYFTLQGANRHGLHCRKYFYLPATDNGVYALFRQLGINNVLTLFEACLMELKILFTSRNYYKLNDACRATEALIYPLRYCHVFIPVLPFDMLGVVEAPTPYIIGVHTDHLERIHPVGESILIVNLDVASVNFSPNCSNILTLPKKLREALISDILKILQPSEGIYSRESFSTSVELNVSPECRFTKRLSSQRASNYIEMDHSEESKSFRCSKSSDAVLRAVFLCLFVKLFSTYREYLLVIRICPKPVVILNKQKFLIDRMFRNEEFLQRLFETMLFHKFIEERGLPFRNFDLFDDLCSRDCDNKRSIHEIACFFAENEPELHESKLLDGQFDRLFSQVKMPLHPFPFLSTSRVNHIIQNYHDPNLSSPLNTELVKHTLSVDTLNNLYTSKDSKSGVPNKIDIDYSFLFEKSYVSDTESYKFGMLKSQDVIISNGNTWLQSKRIDLINECLLHLFQKRLFECQHLLNATLHVLRRHQHERHTFIGILEEYVHSGRLELSEWQFYILVDLIDSTIQGIHENGEFNVAYPFVLIANSFYYKPSAIDNKATRDRRFIHNALGPNEIWSDCSFWQLAFYSDLQKQLIVLYTCEMDYSISQHTPDDRITDDSISYTIKAMIILDRIRASKDVVPLFLKDRNLSEAEEQTISSLLISYIQYIINMWQPLIIASSDDIKFRFKNENDITEETNDISVSLTDQLSLFIFKFTERICSDTSMSDENKASLLIKLEQIVQVECEQLAHTFPLPNLSAFFEYDYIKRSLQTNYVINYYNKVLLFGECILFRGLPAILFSNDCSMHTGRAGLLPVQGILLITNYRLLFLGYDSLTQTMRAERLTVSASMILSSIVYVSILGFDKRRQCENDDILKQLFLRPFDTIKSYDTLKQLENIHSSIYFKSFNDNTLRFTFSNEVQIEDLISLQQNLKYILCRKLPSQYFFTHTHKPSKMKTHANKKDLTKLHNKNEDPLYQDYKCSVVSNQIDNSNDMNWRKNPVKNYYNKGLGSLRVYSKDRILNSSTSSKISDIAPSKDSISNIKLPQTFVSTGASCDITYQHRNFDTRFSTESQLIDSSAYSGNYEHIDSNDRFSSRTSESERLPDIIYPSSLTPSCCGNPSNQFGLIADYHRLNLCDINDNLEMSNLNQNFGLCSTYPQTVVTLKFSQEPMHFINKIVPNFQSRRFPVVVYRHETSGALLMRSAKPIYGVYLMSELSRRILHSEKPSKTIKKLYPNGNISPLTVLSSGSFTYSLHSLNSLKSYSPWQLNHVNTPCITSNPSAYDKSNLMYADNLLRPLDAVDSKYSRFFPNVSKSNIRKRFGRSCDNVDVAGDQSFMILPKSIQHFEENPSTALQSLVVLTNDGIRNKRDWKSNEIKKMTKFFGCLFPSSKICMTNAFLHQPRQVKGAWIKFIKNIDNVSNKLNNVVLIDPNDSSPTNNSDSVDITHFPDSNDARQYNSDKNIKEEKLLSNFNFRSTDTQEASKDIHNANESLGWYDWILQIHDLLCTAWHVNDYLESGKSVLISLEYGTTMTTQLSSLVQIISDPYYRTIKGFISLLQKEWIEMGHHFNDLPLSKFEFTHTKPEFSLDNTKSNGRQIKRRRNSSSTKSKLGKADDAPWLLQFLDAVHQILRKCPLSFEFNDFFLRTISYHIKSDRFYQFMCDYEQCRFKFFNALKAQDINLNCTRDFWKYLLSVNELFPVFQNPMYIAKDLSYQCNTYYNDKGSPTSKSFNNRYIKCPLIAEMDVWNFYFEDSVVNVPIYDTNYIHALLETCLKLATNSSDQPHSLTESPQSFNGNLLFMPICLYDYSCTELCLPDAFVVMNMYHCILSSISQGLTSSVPNGYLLKNNENTRNQESMGSHKIEQCSVDTAYEDYFGSVTTEDRFSVSALSLDRAKSLYHKFDTKEPSIVQGELYDVHLTQRENSVDLCCPCSDESIFSLQSLSNTHVDMEAGGACQTLKHISCTTNIFTPEIPKENQFTTVHANYRYASFQPKTNREHSTFLDPINENNRQSKSTVSFDSLSLSSEMPAQIDKKHYFSALPCIVPSGQKITMEGILRKRNHILRNHWKERYAIINECESSLILYSYNRNKLTAQHQAIRYHQQTVNDICENRRMGASFLLNYFDRYNIPLKNLIRVNTSIDAGLICKDMRNCEAFHHCCIFTLVFSQKQLWFSAPSRVEFEAWTKVLSTFINHS